MALSTMARRTWIGDEGFDVLHYVRLDAFYAVHRVRRSLLRGLQPSTIFPLNHWTNNGFEHCRVQPRQHRRGRRAQPRQ
jgi:hypothetical protein